MERESMVFYKSFMVATDDLEPELYKTVIKMVLHYAMEGKEPEGDTIAKAFFSLIKPQIDANNRRYANGKQGGRKSNQDETKVEPKPNQTITKGKPNHNQDETKVEPNVNDNVNDNVNVNDLKDINSRAGTTACVEPEPDSATETKGEPRPEQAKKPKKAKEVKADTEATEVIEYLNKKTGSAYKASSKANIGVIRARLNDGYTVEDCKKVIDTKAGQWLNNPDMVKYLRPETLFRPSKFEGYLNECRGKPSIRGDSPPLSEQEAFNRSISEAVQRQMMKPVENPVTDEMLDALGIK